YTDEAFVAHGSRRRFIGHVDERVGYAFADRIIGESQQLHFLAADISRQHLDEFAGDAGLTVKQLKEMIAVDEGQFAIFQRLRIVGIGLLKQDGSIAKKRTIHVDVGGQLAAIQVRQEPAHLAFLREIDVQRGIALLVDELLFLVNLGARALYKLLQ